MSEERFFVWQKVHTIEALRASRTILPAQANKDLLECVHDLLLLEDTEGACRVLAMVPISFLRTKEAGTYMEADPEFKKQVHNIARLLDVYGCLKSPPIVLVDFTGKFKIPKV